MMGWGGSMNGCVAEAPEVVALTELDRYDIEHMRAGGAVPTIVVDAALRLKSMQHVGVRVRSS